jgi:hypothetical protein
MLDIRKYSEIRRKEQLQEPLNNEQEQFKRSDSFSTSEQVYSSLNDDALLDFVEVIIIHTRLLDVYWTSINVCVCFLFCDVCLLASCGTTTNTK